MPIIHPIPAKDRKHQKGAALVAVLAVKDTVVPQERG